MGKKSDSIFILARYAVKGTSVLPSLGEARSNIYVHALCSWNPANIICIHMYVHTQDPLIPSHASARTIIIIIITTP